MQNPRQNKYKAISALKDFKKIQILPEEAFSIKQVENIIDYSFRKKQILLVALTHRSYINILKKHKSTVYTNERIEFLGDAILEFIISEFLFKKFPEFPEGTLTLIRAASVRTETLASVFKELGLNQYILLGPGEVRTGGREKPYILANMYEALIGALYLDGGLKHAKSFINKTLFPKAEIIIKNKSYIDPKTHLQEITQKHFKETPVYEIIKEQGLAHEKIYTSVVKLKDKVLGTGVGPSKQKSQEDAAQKALDKLKKTLNKIKNKKNAKD